MIQARVAGTALHLSLDSNKNGDTIQISYKKYRIWGIKSLIKFLVEDLFNIFYNNLPKDEKNLNPEEDLKKPLKILAERYTIPYKNILQFIEQRKEHRLIWETLDIDQQVVFIINAFFEAFEENLVNSYYISMSWAKFLWLNPRIKPRLKPTDFGLKDFGFVFRARGYAFIASKCVFNDGFSNTVKRLNKVLLQEYNETFIEKKDNIEITTEAPISLEDLPEEKRYVIEMLKQGNSHEKLEAISIIMENKIKEALNELEYLLNYENDEVMNAAFDAILVLKELD